MIMGQGTHLSGRLATAGSRDAGTLVTAGTGRTVHISLI